MNRNFVVPHVNLLATAVAPARAQKMLAAGKNIMHRPSTKTPEMSFQVDPQRALLYCKVSVGVHRRPTNVREIAVAVIRD